MLRLLYDCCIFLYGIAMLPKVLLQRGEYAPTLRMRLGLVPIKHDGAKKRIWIHAVSVGEVKVASLLLPHIHTTFPGASLTVTCTTKTGMQNAERLFPSDTQILLLPLDLSFVMRPFVRKIAPHYFFLIESDFFYNLSTELKTIGAKLFLINGKISDRSYRRLLKVPTFAHKLFAPYTTLFVQDEDYYARFTHLSPRTKTIVIPNLKFDAPRLEAQEQKGIVFGSTHKEEEPLLLPIIEKLTSKHPSLPITIVPRHPERFLPFYELLKARNLDVSLFSEKADTQIILVDAMGQLMQVYARSELSIVAGSFCSPLEGHDVYEPIRARSIPIYGEYTSAQAEMTRQLAHHKCSVQTSASTLYETIITLLSNEEKRSELRRAGERFAAHAEGSISKMWHNLEEKLD